MEVMQRIGVDAVSVDRIALAVKRSGRGFLNKVYTPAELDYTGTNSERLAGRWAAKEAVIKCFDGTGICFPRRRIEVLPGPNGAPRVRLLGDDRGARVEVSITHHGGLAVATSHLEMPDTADSLLPAPESVVLPERPKDAHKGTFGTVVVLAGSLGFTGAAYLAATGAARAGAGLVRLLVAETIYPILAAKCTEVMATPVQEVAPGAVGHAAYDSVLRQLATVEVGVIGPGLGRDRSSWRDCWARPPRRSRRTGPAPRAGRPRSGGRSSSSRARTRWSLTLTGASARILMKSRRWPQEGPATSCPV